VLSLYGLSGFIGDILSYSRLFALGLVTGVLALVINLLAGMTAEIPVIGWFIMVLILIGGHLFNFFINILGSFVHTARLQYVEYFSKFFEGGGRFFRPFSWQTKYIKLEK
jgi:V/A-type H+-transporting ATPase subunit I